MIEQEDIKRLTQTVKATDGNTVEIETGEVIDSNESNPYAEIISRLLENKIKLVR